MGHKITALLLGLGVAGGIFALAATLGGVTTAGLGADAVVVASCDTDGVTVGYTTAYDTTANEYEVTTVAVSGIHADCNGGTIDLTLSNTSGSSTATATQGTISGTSINLTIPNGFSAESTERVAIVIED